MANKRIDELTPAVPGNVDVVPTSYATTGPAYKSTVASVVAAGLNQPNSATSGAGANITIKAADGVTSGAGGSIVITPGLQAATGGNGFVNFVGSAQTLKLDLSTIYATFTNTVSGYFVFGSGINYVQVPSLVIGGTNRPSIDTVKFATYQTYSFRLSSATEIVWIDTVDGAGGTTRCGFGYAAFGSVKVTDGSTGGGSLAFTHSDINLTGITDAAAFTGSGYQRIITGGTVLNGILPPSGGAHVSGRMIKIVNTLGSNITVNNESASCTVVGNRLKIPSGSSLNLGANHMLQCIYDTVDSRWRVWMNS